MQTTFEVAAPPHPPRPCPRVPRSPTHPSSVGPTTTSSNGTIGDQILKPFKVTKVHSSISCATIEGTQSRTQWRMGVQHPIAHNQHARWTIRESLKDKTSRDPCGVLTLRFLFFSFWISHRISLGGPRILDQGADSMGRWSRILFHSLVHIG